MNTTTQQSNKQGIVSIHGKEYMTVARRVELAHEDKAIQGIKTEVLSHNPVVIKAAVFINGVEYNGISSVNLDSLKQIEKSNPYEVAETSAVGRALGFAGYGIVEGIASADEVVRAVAREPQVAPVQKPIQQTPGAPMQETDEIPEALVCEVCGEPAKEKSGTTKSGKPYHGIFCSTEERSHTRWINN